MEILSIGNSFSQDAQKYLHYIAKADGVNLNAFNLYIGGCPISQHFRNMLSEQDAYGFEINGVSTRTNISLKDGLLNREWDVITIQQASHESPYYDKYQPYLDRLVEYIRMCAPKAKIAIHQTWAYEQDSEKLNLLLGYKDHTDMFKDLEKAYQKAFEDTKADILIPSGKVLQELIKAGIPKVHRDTFHASLGAGRYAIGLTWYATLTGNSVKNNTFCDFDREVSKEEMEIIKKCVSEVTGV